MRPCDDAHLHGELLEPLRIQGCTHGFRLVFAVRLLFARIARRVNQFDLHVRIAQTIGIHGYQISRLDDFHRELILAFVSDT